MVKKATFDDDKINIIKAYANNATLLTSQVSQLLKSFYADDKKLEVAKNLYPIVIDKQNYFTIADAFTFRDVKENFLQYINNQQTGRPSGYTMPQATYNQLYERINKEPFDDEKTRLIKLAIQNSAPTTAQITGLLKLYAFEDKALDCAKFVYTSVTINKTILP